MVVIDVRDTGGRAPSPGFSEEDDLAVGAQTGRGARAGQGHPHRSGSPPSHPSPGHCQTLPPLVTSQPRNRSAPSAQSIPKPPRLGLHSDICSIVSGYDRCPARGTAAASLPDERVADQPRHHYRGPPSGGPSLDPVGGRRGGARHGARDRLDSTRRQGPLGNPTVHPRGLGLGWRCRTCVAPSTQSGQESASTEVQQ